MPYAVYPADNMPRPCCYTSSTFCYCSFTLIPGGRALTASGPQLAMGRVVGSLCVVTAKDEDASSAMLASWVSQVG